MKKWGKKVYILAADYNYGQITAKWLQHYIAQRKGTVPADRLLPARRRRLRLDHREDPAGQARLRGRGAGRRRAHVVLPAVGGVGHEQEDPAGFDHLRRRQRAPGAVARGRRRHPDRRQLQPGGRRRRPTRSSSRAGQKRFGDTKIVHEIAVSQYQGIMLWAECVKKAGSLDREKMLEGDRVRVSASTGPAGTVTIDPKTHHAIARHPPDGSEEPEADDQAARSSSSRRPTPRSSATCEEPEREQAVRGEDLTLRPSPRPSSRRPWTTPPSSFSRSST